MKADTTARDAERAEADTVSCTVAEQIAWVEQRGPRSCTTA